MVSHARRASLYGINCGVFGALAICLPIGAMLHGAGHLDSWVLPVIVVGLGLSLFSIARHLRREFGIGAARRHLGASSSR